MFEKNFFRQSKISLQDYTNTLFASNFLDDDDCFFKYFLFVMKTYLIWLQLRIPLISYICWSLLLFLCFIGYIIIYVINRYFFCYIRYVLKKDTTLWAISLLSFDKYSILLNSNYNLIILIEIVTVSQYLIANSR